MTATMRALAGVLGVALAAGSASAQDLSNLTTEDRKVLRAEMRDYLMSNPEIIEEAEAALEQKRARAARERDGQVVADNLDALHADPLSAETGDPEGDFTVVVFSDFSCPHCEAFHPDLLAFSEDNPEVRVVFKEMPILGQRSVMAAAFAVAVHDLAGDDAYVTAAERIFEEQGALNGGTYDDIASEIDLDREKITARMNEKDVRAHLQANLDLAEEMGIRGTPAIVMDDVILRGAPDPENLQRAYEILRED